MCAKGKVVTDGGDAVEPRIQEKSSKLIQQPSKQEVVRVQCPGKYVCCTAPKEEPGAVSEPLKLKQKCGTSAIMEITSTPTSNTTAGEIPWQVAVLKKNGTDNLLICSGVLVHTRVVVTVAHCVSRLNSKQLLVTVGDWDLSVSTEPHPAADREVSEIIVHSGFKWRGLINDIAILILDKDVPATPNIGTVCLPPPGFAAENSKCFVTGWGKDRKEGTFSAKLRRVDLKVLTNSDCQEKLRSTRLSPFFELDKNFVCALGEKDACEGDGGGPLTCNKDGQQMLVGIVAWGVGCNEKNTPGIYMRVANYLKFINDTIARADV
jgi:secreted trypsin-like serine protease